MAMSDKKSQDIWVDKIAASSRVTWKNSALNLYKISLSTHMT